MLINFFFYYILESLVCFVDLKSLKVLFGLLFCMPSTPESVKVEWSLKLL